MGPSRSVALPRLRAAAGLGVTLTLTAGLLAGLPTVLTPALTPLLAPTGRPLGLDDLIVLGCALVLVPAWCRLALGVVLCLGEELVRGPRGARGPEAPGPSGLAPSRLRPALARRVARMVVGSGVGGLVLAAGVPLTATAAGVTPDVGPDDTVAPSSLADRAARRALPLPHRPVGGLATAATPRPAPAPAVAPRPDADAPVVVRPGDTLWALASRHLLAPDASDRQVDAAWHRLYAANRAVLGPDPDLIRPGSRLDLPAPAPMEGHP